MLQVYQSSVVTTLVKIAQLKMEKLLLLVAIAAETVWIQTGKVMKTSKDVFLRLK